MKYAIREMALYGYADTLSGVKLERVRSVLLKRFRYNHNNVSEVMTRADFINKAIESKNNIEPYSYKGKTCYRVWDSEHYAFTDITKTEYDFAQWLLAS